MTTKHNRRTKQGASELLEQAQRSLKKGDFKEALKDAKVCYRQQPSPEGRQLLERAYLARGRQLHQAGLRAEAQAVATSLVDLGVTDAAVGRELPDLLIAVGLFNRAANGRGAALREDDALYIAAVDHAVVRPDAAPSSLPAVGRGAAAVRQALAALEAGEEAAAMAAIADIPRASPFADWKYFVRGLAAYYREDAAAMQANWERLDPQRFAARIASSLKALANGDAANDAETAERLARLGWKLAGGPVFERLQALQSHALAGRWREAVKLLRVLAPRLRQTDPALSDRLEATLYASILRKGDPLALRELTAVGRPPALDPRWNRGLAIAWEQCRDGDVDYVEDHWRAYLEDLAGLECLSPAERALAQALVWLRLGGILMSEARPVCPTCGVCHRPDETLQARAIACFETSLKLAPTLLGAHQALALAWRACKEPRQAAAAYRRLVERFPENLDGLLFLADHYMTRDEPLAAREFLVRARRLKPLDAKIKAMVEDVHLESARHHALAGRWDDGRAELAAAESTAAAGGEGCRRLVHRAILEMKAGQERLAWRWLDEARSGLGEPSPVWLLATVAGARYALPKAVGDELEARWVTAMKRNCGSLALGEMCRIMHAYVGAEVDYPGRNEHVGFLLDRLRRPSSRPWDAGDLRSVLDFLMSASLAKKAAAARSSQHADPGGVLKLLAKFATKARAKFPGNAFFQLTAGEMEMRKGPHHCRRTFARRCFQRAAQVAEAAGGPEDLEIAKRAKEKLLFLDAHAREAPRDRFPLPPPGEDEPTAGLDDLPDDTGAGGETFSPGSLFEIFARACRERGLDPEEVLDKMSDRGGFRFRAEGPPDSQRRERK